MGDLCAEKLLLKASTRYERALENLIDQVSDEKLKMELSRHFDQYSIWSINLMMILNRYKTPTPQGEVKKNE